jgi:hypothetical protein
MKQSHHEDTKNAKIFMISSVKIQALCHIGYLKKLRVLRVFVVFVDEAQSTSTVGNKTVIPLMLKIWHH